MVILFTIYSDLENEWKYYENLRTYFSRRPYESWLVSARSRLYKGNNPRVVSVWKTTERNIAVGELRKPKFVFLENAWSRNSMHHIGIAGRFLGPLLIRRGWSQWPKNVCCCLLEIGEQIQCGHSLKNIIPVTVQEGTPLCIKWWKFHHITILYPWWTVRILLDVWIEDQAFNP